MVSAHFVSIGIVLKPAANAIHLWPEGTLGGVESEEGGSSEAPEDEVDSEGGEAESDADVDISAEEIIK